MFKPYVTTSLTGSEAKNTRELIRSDLRKIIDASHYMELDTGAVKITPETVIADRHTGLEICYTVCNEPLAQGAHISILFPEYWGGIVQEYDCNTFSVTPEPGRIKGYVGAHLNAHASDPAVRLEGTVTCQGSVHTAFDVVILDKDLAVGETITFVIGDPIGQLPVTIEFAGTYKFIILADREGNFQYKRTEFLEVKVIGDRAESFAVTASSSPAEINIPVKVTALDRMKNLSPDTHEEYHLFLDNDFNNRITNPAKKILPGTHRITAVDYNNGIAGKSDPFTVGPWCKEGYVFYGDLHFHSDLSDGVRTLEEAFAYGRNVRALDFIAPGDHFEPEVQPGYYYKKELRWDITREMVNKYHRDREFVCLLGYELGTWYHRNVIYKNTDEPCYPATGTDPYDVWEKLKGRKAFTLVHQTKYWGKPAWQPHNDEIERLAEIYSTWGSSEEYSEASVQAGLQKGHRLGIICGTDTHTGRPGMGNRTFYGCGLAAVIAPVLTRDAIWTALYNRSCYGTTGARILMDFRLDDACMGSVIKGSGKARVFRIRITGSEKIKSAVIIKNNHTLHSFSGIRENSLDESWTESESSIRSEFKNQQNPQSDYYYLRMEQIDGHMAWSSPVWADL
ncbi:MAG TPA: hypothetical protein DC049_05030 [Spirochaetia bacterium]|nr:hypothetical protein [Spirochaetia bacterium]